MITLTNDDDDALEADTLSRMEGCVGGQGPGGGGQLPQGLSAFTPSL